MALETIGTVSRTGSVVGAAKVVDDGAQRVLVRLDRSTWGEFSGAEMDVGVFASLDGGKTWVKYGGGKCRCGPCEYDGLPRNTWSIQATLPNGRGRQVRVDFTCLNKRVTSTVAMEIA